MLTFNLKKEWFEKIKSGEKTHEYREVKDYWANIFVKEFFQIDKKKRPLDFECYKRGMNIYLQTNLGKYNNPSICFMNGMISEDVKPRIYAKMKSIRIINGLTTDLKINKPVYDIEFELIKEQEEPKEKIESQQLYPDFDAVKEILENAR